MKFKSEAKIKSTHDLFIVVVSNIVFEPYLNSELHNAFSEIGIKLNVSYINYEDCESLESQKILFDSDIVVINFNFAELYPNWINDVISKNILLEDFFKNVIKQYKKIYLSIRQKTVGQIIWFGFEDYCYNCDNIVGTLMLLQGLVDKINIELNKFICKQDIFIDFKKMVAEIGIINAFDSKGKYRWKAPYSKKLISKICNEIYKQYLIYNGKTKKCIVLDCDNVLWGGVLSEDGLDNIFLSSSGFGRPYQDFQKYMLYLYYSGVILAICSKNDISDVMFIFNNHNEMILNEEHIACFQVNWESKPENIKRIAEALNIGLDSIVFIDDSDFEINSVKYFLPEVTTIKFNKNTIYKQLNCFNLKNNIDFEKVKQRNMTYKTNRDRNELKKICNSFDDYINALEIKIDIHLSTPIEFSRLSELTQRTNKCTNGMRYTVDQLRENTNNGLSIYSVFVSDKFSNLGLVGAFAIFEETLTLFCLSCRALGRKIEHIMFQWILDNHHIKNIIFNSTSKNENIKEILNKYFPNALVI